MSESRTVGWYVKIPRSLRKKFDDLYPGRQNKKILTITAIQHAIDMHPGSLYNLYKGAKDGTLQRREANAEGDSTKPSGGEEAGT